MNKFKQGDVGVANSTINYTCGIIKVNKGDIVKIIECNNNNCFVYKNKRLESMNEDITLPTSCIDVPNNMSEMKKKYKSGIKNIY